MMKLKLSASLLALALLASPVVAQDATTADEPSAEAPASADDTAGQATEPETAQDVEPEPDVAQDAEPDGEAAVTQAAAAKPDPRFERQALQLLGDAEPRASVGRAGLAKRIQLAQKLLQSGKLSAATAAKLKQFMQADKVALSGGAAKPKPQISTRPVPVEKQAATASASEQTARAVLADRKPASTLDDRTLAKRLSATRVALGKKDISAQTRVQLRRKLQEDTQVIRQRRELAQRKAEAKREEARNKQKSKTKISVSINLGSPAVVLSDRRPGDELSTEELQHRIRIYRDVEGSGEYASYRDDERAYWRRTLNNDRELLRRRLLEEKHRREAEIAQEERDGTLNRDIVINVEPQAVDDPDEDVYVAEADDRQIEEILVAPPRQRVAKRYTVEEVANDREVRRSVPRLELDTIHFDFGAATVREEEVRNLDRIGSVMERILKRYPREVFLIEGHTDAVGSDLSNLYLSRSRAEAVKQALMTYYDIPARNLRTAGLGERFLKIPTESAEAENRRVSVSRVTQFIGEAD